MHGCQWKLPPFFRGKFGGPSFSTTIPTIIISWRISQSSDFDNANNQHHSQKLHVYDCIENSHSCFSSCPGQAYSIWIVGNHRRTIYRGIGLQISLLYFHFFWSCLDSGERLQRLGYWRRRCYYKWTISTRHSSRQPSRPPILPRLFHPCHESWTVQFRHNARTLRLRWGFWTIKTPQKRPPVLLHRR